RRGLAAWLHSGRRAGYSALFQLVDRLGWTRDWHRHSRNRRSAGAEIGTAANGPPRRFVRYAPSMCIIETTVVCHQPRSVEIAADPGKRYRLGLAPAYLPLWVWP